MGLFGRLGTLIRSNINELINRAEDPEKMLNQVLVDMKGQLVEAKKQVAVAIADEKRIKKQYEQELAKAQDWERKAMLAVRAGDDNLARAALARKTEHDELFASIRSGKAIKNGDYMAKSTLLAIMGRMAAYTGQLVTWDQAMNSQEDLSPPRYDWDVELPVPPVAKPGVTKFV